MGRVEGEEAAGWRKIEKGEERCKEDREEERRKKRKEEEGERVSFRVMVEVEGGEKKYWR